MSTKLMKALKTFAACAVCAFAFLSATAATYNDGTYTWTYSASGGKATLTTGTHNSPAISPSPTVALSIPRKLASYDLTVIGIGAFWGTGVKGINNWGSIVKIDQYAFATCNSLTTVTIPDMVTSLGADAFWDCNALATLKIGSGVTTIPEHLASSCEKLAYLTIGPNVTTIGQYAFAGAKALKSVIIPEKVTTIATKAFNGCSSLKTAYLPISLKDKITVSEIFSNCAADFKVVYYGTVTVGSYDYKYLLSDGEIEIYDLMYGETAISPSPTGSLVIPASITIPSTTEEYPVTAIGSYAFSDCTGMTEVRISAVVKTIDSNAFTGCSGLTDVEIWSSEITTIGSDAFRDCSSLERVSLPLTLKGKIDESDIFYNCPKSLTVLYWSKEYYYVEEIDGIQWTFRRLWDRDTGLYYASIVNDGHVAAVSPKPSGAVKIPSMLGGEQVQVVSSYAFYECGEITSIEFEDPESIKYFGEYVFEGCGSLTSITLPPSMYSITRRMFSGCYSLNEIELPEGIDHISKEAFEHCLNLETINIPASVTAIYNNAFYYCRSLKTVRVALGDAERVDALLRESGFDTSGITYEECSDTQYRIRLHRYDGSDEKVANYLYTYGVSAALPKLNDLGWARKGFDFKGWATSQANAAKGIVWKADGASVLNAAEPGKTFELWPIWKLKSDYYAIQFIRNDGAGTWRIVGFKYGEKTRMPTLAKGLGWARRGYDFNGWAQTAANANNGIIWKGDWGYVATPVAAGSTLTIYASWSLKPGYYQIRFNKNDGTGKWRTLGFALGESAKLNTITGLGWRREGHPFKGWGSNKANADAGKIWKKDGAWVKDATAEGKTLSIYAIWE